MFRQTINYVITTGLLVGCLIIQPGTLHAQHDPTYYTSYSKFLTTRFFFSQKYTALRVKDHQDHYTLHYLPNTTLNMGIGATYKWATLNLAYGFGFLNPELDKGKTEYLDLQFHGYGEKFNLDVLAQFYKGFYLYPNAAVPTDGYYNRADLRVALEGVSCQYIFNHRRFSFRSSTLQNDWQKKSAGTFLVGIEAYTGSIKSDSALVPTQVDPAAASQNEKRTVFFEMGPNVGYAYTWVIAQNFFLTGSASVSWDYGFTKVFSQSGTDSRSGLIMNTFGRFSCGYNSAKWAISLVYVNNGVNLAGSSNARQLTLNTGNLRVNYVVRIRPGKKQKKMLDDIIQ